MEGSLGWPGRGGRGCGQTHLEEYTQQQTCAWRPSTNQWLWEEEEEEEEEVEVEVEEEEEEEEEDEEGEEEKEKVQTLLTATSHI